MLDVTDLTVRYGPFLALDGISLNVERGEIVGLIGPNGAGKSTLVRTIAGLVPPAAGAIRFKEQPLAGRQPFQRVAAGLSLVPEGRGLFPYMSVEENLLMGAYSLHDTRRARMVMERWLNLFPILRERKRQLAGTLSGGQQQMLAVAMGLMCEPDLCMLDEPSLGLAPIVISDIVSALRELKRSGVTVLLAEQNAKLASDVADRIYVLQTGRVRYHDIPENLLRNREVAEAFLSVY